MTKISTKYSFYNQHRGLKYIPSVDKTFCIGFNRYMFDFVHPCNVIEMSKPREISQIDRMHNDRDDHVMVEVQ